MQVSYRNVDISIRIPVRIVFLIHIIKMCCPRYSPEANTKLTFVFALCCLHNCFIFAHFYRGEISRNTSVHLYIIFIGRYLCFLSITIFALYFFVYLEADLLAFSFQHLPACFKLSFH